MARIKLDDGTTRTAELHWYEGHGTGRKETNIDESGEDYLYPKNFFAEIELSPRLARALALSRTT
ncbi:MAG TPA: hypothetical protein VGJ84_14745 [Polyangiaceae bacterium]|jgi:hypothetical protein